MFCVSVYWAASCVKCVQSVIYRVRKCSVWVFIGLQDVSNVCSLLYTGWAKCSVWVFIGLQGVANVCSLLYTGWAKCSVWVFIVLQGVANVCSLLYTEWAKCSVWVFIGLEDVANVCSLLYTGWAKCSVRLSKVGNRLGWKLQWVNIRYYVWSVKTEGVGAASKKLRMPR